ncbi:MAG: PP0621 family protein [Agitococcus sp.]
MGTILRLLILAGIVWFIYSFIKRTLVQQKPHQQPTATLMHQCAECGVHTPQHEAILFEGLYFCSEAHKNNFLQRKP